MLDKRMGQIRNFTELLNLTAETYAEAPALVLNEGGQEKTVSYTEFNFKVRKVADYLDRTYGKGKLYIIPGNLCTEWMYVYYGILYSGGIVAPLDCSVPEILAERISKLKPDVILTEKGNAGKIAEMLNAHTCIVKTETISQVCENAFQTKDEDAVRREPCDPNTTAMLVFTSGTTGENKIVEVTHRNLCADSYLSLVYHDPDYPGGARFLSALPLFHLYAITSCVISPIVGGYSVCIGGGVWKLRSDIQFFRPHLLMVVPMMVYSFASKLFPNPEQVTPEQLQMAKMFFGGRLRLLVTGGAPLGKGYADLLTLIGIFLMNGYGITECSPIVSFDTDTDHKEGSVGRPGILPEICDVKLIDSEICVRGEIVSPGYWNEPELNKLVYKDGWFHTGDLGKLDDDGFLFITGRKKNILILPDGNNISLDELEKQLSSCPSIESAIVLGKEMLNNPVLEAVVVPKKDTGLSQEDLEKQIDGEIEAVNKKNPRYKRIAQIRFLDTDFERTPLGKVRKFKYET